MVHGDPNSAINIRLQGDVKNLVFRISEHIRREMLLGNGKYDYLGIVSFLLKTILCVGLPLLVAEVDIKVTCELCKLECEWLVKLANIEHDRFADKLAQIVLA